MRDDYFDWLYSLACDGREDLKFICALLHGIEFIYVIPMDDNRYADGISLRYRFGYDNDIPDAAIASELDTKPCSVFEMMVALALRMEEDVMATAKEDRTSIWFMQMLESLDLIDMTDDRFDENEARYIIDRFLNREYRRDGAGGLFTIKNRPDKDLRDVEIWYQAMWHLNDILKGEKK